MLRKFTVASVAAALLLVMAMTATASHRNPLLVFDPSDNVDVGTAVTVTASATDTSPPHTARQAHVDGCQLEVDQTPLPFESCTAGEDVGEVNADGAVWVELASGTPATYTAPTDTAGVFGYRARSAHDSDPGNLTVTAVTSAQRHNGCNGIENAKTKVPQNSNAKDKLEQIAERFNCDE